MKNRRLLILLAAAALVPFFPARTSDTTSAFPGWPSPFSSMTLLPLTDREQRFAEDFPGKLARFQHGNREWILRWIAAPTRRLHPAWECFRGAGYEIDPAPVEVDAGGRWSCFTASDRMTRLRVCERIWDSNGRSWTQPSDWYWPALFGRSAGPWWSAVRAEPIT